MSVAGNDYRLQKKVYREVTVNRQTSVGCYFLLLTIYHFVIKTIIYHLFFNSFTIIPVCRIYCKNPIKSHKIQIAAIHNTI